MLNLNKALLSLLIHAHYLVVIHSLTQTSWTTMRRMGQPVSTKCSTNKLQNFNEILSEMK